MTSSRYSGTPAEELIYSNEKDLLQVGRTEKSSAGILTAEELSEVAAVFKLLSKWRDEDKNSKAEVIVRQNVEGPEVSII